jgi:hypothetical protein
MVKAWMYLWLKGFLIELQNRTKNAFVRRVPKSLRLKGSPTLIIRASPINALTRSRPLEHLFLSFSTYLDK